MDSFVYSSPPPPDTAYGNIHTLALIDHAPPRFPDSRVREISIDVKMTGA